MTAPDDGLEALLAEHMKLKETTGPAGEVIICKCGQWFKSRREHAVDHHAAVVRAAGWRKWPELEPVRTWYRSLYGNGRIWCESRDPDEVREASKKRKDCTFERYDTYEVTEGWQPWEA